MLFCERIGTNHSRRAVGIDRDRSRQVREDVVQDCRRCTVDDSNAGYRYCAHRKKELLMIRPTDESTTGLTRSRHVADDRDAAGCVAVEDVVDQHSPDRFTQRVRRWQVAWRRRIGGIVQTRAPLRRETERR